MTAFQGDSIIQTNPQLTDAAIVMVKRMTQVMDNGYQHRVTAGSASDFEKHWQGARFERATADWAQVSWTGRDRLGAADVGPFECRASYRVVEFWWILQDQLEKKPDKDYLFGVVPRNSRRVSFVGWVPGRHALKHPNWQEPTGLWNVPHQELFNLDSLRRKHGGDVQEDLFGDNPLAW